MSKYAAYGAQLQYNPGAGYTAIAGVKDISGPGLSLNAIDVTTHDSSDGFREFLPGLADGGEVSFDLAFDPEELNGQYVLSQALINRTVAQTYKLVFRTTNSKTWTFSAIVTAFSVSNPLDNEIQASVTMKVTGKPTTV